MHDTSSFLLTCSMFNTAVQLLRLRRALCIPDVAQLYEYKQRTIPPPIEMHPFHHSQAALVCVWCSQTTISPTTSPTPCARAATFARRCSTVSSPAFGKPQSSDDIFIWVACLTFVLAPCSQRFRCTQWHKRKIRAS